MIYIILGLVTGILLIGVINANAVSAGGNVTVTIYVNGIPTHKSITIQAYNNGLTLNKLATIISKCNNAVAINNTSVVHSCQELSAALRTILPQIQDIIGNHSQAFDNIMFGG
jgi:hypothetical protein